MLRTVSVWGVWIWIWGWQCGLWALLTLLFLPSFRDRAGNDACDQPGHGHVLGHVPLERHGDHGETPGEGWAAPQTCPTVRPLVMGRCLGVLVLNPGLCHFVLAESKSFSLISVLLASLAHGRGPARGRGGMSWVLVSQSRL